MAKKPIPKRPPKRAPKRSKQPTIEKGHRIRIVIAGAALSLCFMVVAARLVQLQVDPDLRFSEEDIRHIGKIQIDRPRGDILDRRGRTLATNRMVPSLSVNPGKVTDARELARFLAPRLGVTEHDLMEPLLRTNKHGVPMKFVWLKRRMTKDEAARLGDLSALPQSDALMLRQESVRYYPEKELASHILGFVNLEGVGSEGVEAKFNKYLSSESGERISRVDRKRNALGFRTLEYRAPSGGANVSLTIDAALQYTLEQELDKAMELNHSTAAMGILMDPDTGAILAMATRPAFDPNRFNKYTSELRRNRAVTDFFEPGSAFKIITASAALELGLVTPNMQIDCLNGTFNPYGHPISDTHKLGVVSFAETFAQSSNIAIIKVAALLGPERLESWINRFGFGRRTGLEVQLESPGLFRPLKRWNGLSMGSLPMGQEIAVTIPQLAQAFSVIANGGELVEPYMVERVISKEGEVVYSHNPSERQRLISESTAKTMRDLCHLVVTHQDGTGGKAAIQEYRVGGKTGTAQIADEVYGGYYKDKYTTVFAGFAPISDPKITCVIVVTDPRVELHYGGHVCGPIFRNVVREALIKLNVPKDPMILNGSQKPGTMLANGEAYDSDTITARVDFDVLEPTMNNEPVDGLELITLARDTNQTGPVLPSFLGLTRLQAKAKLLELGLQWDPKGAGRVVRQNPAAGTRMEDVRVCKLVFSHGGENDA